MCMQNRNCFQLLQLIAAVHPAGATGWQGQSHDPDHQG